MSKLRGKFITFEGIDGAGKSSHVEPLATALRSRGHEVVVTREPGGPALAEQVKRAELKTKLLSANMKFKHKLGLENIEAPKISLNSLVAI